MKTAGRRRSGVSTAVGRLQILGGLSFRRDRAGEEKGQRKGHRATDLYDADGRGPDSKLSIDTSYPASTDNKTEAVSPVPESSSSQGTSAAPSQEEVRLLASGDKTATSPSDAPTAAPATTQEERDVRKRKKAEHKIKKKQKKLRKEERKKERARRTPFAVDIDDWEGHPRQLD
jgi:hypothetical protein